MDYHILSVLNILPLSLFFFLSCVQFAAARHFGFCFLFGGVLHVMTLINIHTRNFSRHKGGPRGGVAGQERAVRATVRGRVGGSLKWKLFWPRAAGAKAPKMWATTWWPIAAATTSSWATKTTTPTTHVYQLQQQQQQQQTLNEREMHSAICFSFPSSGTRLYWSIFDQMSVKIN